MGKNEKKSGKSPNNPVLVGGVIIGMGALALVLVFQYLQEKLYENMIKFHSDTNEQARIRGDLLKLERKISEIDARELVSREYTETFLNRRIVPMEQVVLDIRRRQEKLVDLIHLAINPDAFKTGPIAGPRQQLRVDEDRDHRRLHRHRMIQISLMKLLSDNPAPPCQAALCTNLDDGIDMEPLMGKTIYKLGRQCYDIDNLLEWLEADSRFSDGPRDPMTRQVIDLAHTIRTLSSNLCTYDHQTQRVEQRTVRRQKGVSRKKCKRSRARKQR